MRTDIGPDICVSSPYRVVERRIEPTGQFLLDLGQRLARWFKLSPRWDVIFSHGLNTRGDPGAIIIDSYGHKFEAMTLAANLNTAFEFGRFRETVESRYRDQMAMKSSASNCFVKAT